MTKEVEWMSGPMTLLSQLLGHILASTRTSLLKFNVTNAGKVGTRCWYSSMFNDYSSVLRNSSAQNAHSSQITKKLTANIKESPIASKYQAILIHCK